MEQFLDISQGIGLALAAGISPLSSLLAAGLLARGSIGLSFSGTGYSFMQGWPFLVAVASVLLLFRAAKGLEPNVRQRSISLQVITMIVVAGGAGALLFAGTLADHGYTVWPGMIGGALVALVGVVAVRTVLGGAERRLEESDGVGLLGAAGDVIAAGVVLVAVLFPPLSYLVVAAVVWLLLVRRRRRARKYQGLRILR